MIAPAAITALAAAALGAPGAHPVPPPHPVITEVYYQIPSPQVGDANKDGAPAVVGDEFVELFNPHEEPIEIGGYTVTDLHENDRFRFSFTFPTPTRLAPGQALVLFNGHAQLRSMPEPYGDKRTPAPGSNDAFGGALVYSMKNTFPSRNFAEKGDMVALVAPDGQVVDLLFWGAFERDVPSDAIRSLRIEPNLPIGHQRLGPWGLMLIHPDIDGRPYSPGEVPTEQTIDLTDDRDAPGDPLGPGPEPGPGPGFEPGPGRR